MMVRLKIIKDTSPFNAGEVATFDKGTAALLVKRGHAVPVGMDDQPLAGVKVDAGVKVEKGADGASGANKKGDKESPKSDTSSNPQDTAGEDAQADQGVEASSPNSEDSDEEAKAPSSRRKR